MTKARTKRILRYHHACAMIAVVVAVSTTSLPASAAVTTNPTTAQQDLAKIRSATQQGKPIPTEALQEPMARVMAKVTNAVAADTRAFGAEYRAAGIDEVIDFDGITPTSPLLDHCDRMGALAARADAVSKRYPDYIALLRREAQVEVDAHHLTPQDVVDSAAGFSEARPTFEQRWTLLGRLTHDVGALCTVLARRHWRTGSTGELEIQDPTDAAEVGRLGLSLQDEMSQLAEIEKTGKAAAEEEARKLETRAH